MRLSIGWGLSALVLLACGEGPAEDDGSSATVLQRALGSSQRLADPIKSFRILGRHSGDEPFAPTTVPDFHQGDSYHIQGLQKHGHLFITSHNEPTEASLGILDVDASPQRLTRVSLGNAYFHAGGVQVLGDVLAVPLADEDEDIIRFYDISSGPRTPSHLEDLDLDPEANAHAVALVDLDATTLAAIVTGTGSMSFFTLNSASEWSSARTWSAESEGWSVNADPCPTVVDWCRPDSINLFRDTQGQVFLLTFGRMGSLLHKERVGLYRVDGPTTASPSLLRVDVAYLNTGGTKGKMRYGGGATVSSLGKLELHAVGKHFAAPGTSTILSHYQEQAAPEDQWSEGAHFDSGHRASVAVDKSWNAIQVHEAASGANAGKLYCTVGKMGPGGGSSWVSAGTWTSGTDPAVTMNNEGCVVEVHNGSQPNSLNQLYVTVGELDFATRGVSWGTGAWLAEGTRVSVAVNSLGDVVEVHQKETSGDPFLYFTVGSLDCEGQRVLWSQPVQPWGPGQDADVAIDDDRHVVVTYNGVGSSHNRLYFAQSVIDSNGNLAFGTATQSGTGLRPTISLARGGRFIEMHSGWTSGTSQNLYYRLGVATTSPSATFSFGPAIYYFTGRDVSVAMDDNWNTLEVHNGNGSNQDKLYFAVARWKPLAPP